MRFTLEWLKDFLDTSAQADQIAEALTNLGLEATINTPCAQLTDFVVVRITATAVHPQADRLQVCTVDTGSELLQIVCGASNARAGLITVLAPIGSLLPQGFKIAKAKIRGVESYGMLCSADELAIKNWPAGIDGIMELPEDVLVGSSLASYFASNAAVIEVNVTPNRGDWLSVYGIARELAAKGLGTLREIPSLTLPSHQTKTTNLISPELVGANTLNLARLCDVENSESPAWLRSRLQSVGLKTISALVDITNYVCHAYGQPMHVYDADSLNGEIKLASAKQDIPFMALDGVEYQLQNGDLVIVDELAKVHALAGVIGSNHSCCHLTSTNIVLEAAVFNRHQIRQTAQRLKISTDAKYRFERGIDAQMSSRALQQAIALVLEICGGQLVSIQQSAELDQPQINIACSIASFRKLVGVEISAPEASILLQSLGFIVHSCDNDTLTVSPPSWRSDITLAEDVFEELARLKGYEHIPAQSFSSYYPPALSSSTDFGVISSSRQLLASLGYNEVISWSFMSSKAAQQFTAIHQEASIINPLTKELNYLRPSIIPNLLQIVADNQRRDITDLALFEIGPVFCHRGELQEVNTISILKTGNNLDRNPHDARRPVDIFDIKSDLALVLAQLRVDDYELTTVNLPTYYNPYCSGAITVSNKVIGYFGQLKPYLLKDYQIDNQVVVLELYIGDITASPPAEHKTAVLSEYPAVNRDLALIVDDNCHVEQLLSALHQTNPLIKSITLFDIYRGSGMGEGKMSLAFNFLIQAPDRTLTDGEVDNLMNRALSIAESKFHAHQRL